MEELRLENKREHHCRIVLEDYKRGVEDEKVILHDKRWDV